MRGRTDTAPAHTGFIPAAGTALGLQGGPGSPEPQPGGPSSGETGVGGTADHNPSPGRRGTDVCVTGDDVCTETPRAARTTASGSYPDRARQAHRRPQLKSSLTRLSTDGRHVYLVSRGVRSSSLGRPVPLKGLYIWAVLALPPLPEHTLVHTNGSEARVDKPGGRYIEYTFAHVLMHF